MNGDPSHLSWLLLLRTPAALWLLLTVFLLLLAPSLSPVWVFEYLTFRLSREIIRLGQTANTHDSVTLVDRIFTAINPEFPVEITALI